MKDPNENRTGYKKTKVGWIPREWNIPSLSAIAKQGKPIVYGIVQAGPHIDGGVPYIRSTDVRDRLVSEGELLRTSSKIAEKYRRAAVAPGDVVFSLRGNIGNTSLVPDALAGANLTQGTARIAVARNSDSAFVNYSLKTHRVRQLIDAWAKGSTFREITIEDLRKVPIPLPPLPEQQKIAEILSTWDDAIEMTRNLIAAKTQQKKALMQQLLTGARRLPGFANSQGRVESPFGEMPADWQMQPLAQVFSKVSRKNTRAVTRVLTASGQSGLVDQRTFFNKSIAAADVSGYYLLERGEFAYNRSAMNGYPYGAIKRLDAHDEGVLSTLYSCFAIKKDRGDADFYMHFFEVGLLNRQLRRITQVGGRAHGLLNITDSDFFSVSIPVPTLKEQRAIAAILDTADRELKSLEDKLAALKEQKKGLMQKLLTGEVRVRT